MPVTAVITYISAYCLYVCNAELGWVAHMTALQDCVHIGYEANCSNRLWSTLGLGSSTLCSVCSRALGLLCIASSAVVGLTTGLGSLVVGVLGSCSSPVGCLLT